jgi:hypothetical protein
MPIGQRECQENTRSSTVDSHVRKGSVYGENGERTGRTMMSDRWGTLCHFRRVAKRHAATSARAAGQAKSIPDPHLQGISSDR